MEGREEGLVSMPDGWGIRTIHTGLQDYLYLSHCQCHRFIHILSLSRHFAAVSEWVSELLRREILNVCPPCRSALLHTIFNIIDSHSQPTNYTVEMLHERKCTQGGVSVYLHLHYSALAT